MRKRHTLLIALLLVAFVSLQAAAADLVVLVDSENDQELAAIDALGFTPVGSMDDLFWQYDPATCAVGIAHSGLQLVDTEWLGEFFSSGATLVAVGWDIDDLFGDLDLDEIASNPELLGVAYSFSDIPISYSVDSEEELIDVLTFACLYADSWPDYGALPFDMSELDFDEIFEEVMAQAGPFLVFMDQFLQPEWEYHVANLAAGVDLEDALNELGAGGWELVTITGDGSMIFKRRALNAERLMGLIFDFAQEMIALGELML